MKQNVEVMVDPNRQGSSDWFHLKVARMETKDIRVLDCHLIGALIPEPNVKIRSDNNCGSVARTRGCGKPSRAAIIVTIEFPNMMIFFQRSFNVSRSNIFNVVFILY